ncbi:MAG: hypothetical protein QM765_52630 [Myxococcales bacterium]
MAATADHGIGALTTRIQAIATVARGYERLNVLAEADKLGLQVVREVLTEAFELLGKRGELERLASQAPQVLGRDARRRRRRPDTFAIARADRQVVARGGAGGAGVRAGGARPALPVS